MSSWLMKLLLIEYVTLIGVFIYFKNWPLALYWLGASILQASVILGMR